MSFQNVEHNISDNILKLQSLKIDDLRKIHEINQIINFLRLLTNFKMQPLESEKYFIYNFLLPSFIIKIQNNIYDIKSCFHMHLKFFQILKLVHQIINEPIR